MPETVFYEGSGADAELAFSCVMGLTLIYAPLTIASIGRRLWVKFRFTNKRVSIINTSPLFKRQIDVAYSKVKEVRIAPRAFGLWGDMVLFLNNGERLELTGLQDVGDLKRHIESCLVD